MKLPRCLKEGPRFSVSSLHPEQWSSPSVCKPKVNFDLSDVIRIISRMICCSSVKF